MKYFLSFIFIVFFTGIVQSQIVNIPDANFKNALLNHSPVIDTNGDNEIQEVEAENFEGLLFLVAEEITNLTGIEAFVNITELNCSSNSLINLDLSSNIQLQKVSSIGTGLSSVNVSQNVDLIELILNFNDITELDISNNTQLTMIQASWCTLLTSLDVTNNVNLDNITIHDTSITTIDLSQNINLSFFGADNGQLVELDVSNNLQLTRILVDNNQISELNLSNNSILQYLLVIGNPMVSIDFSNNPEMFLFNAGHQNLETIYAQNGNNVNIVEFEVSDSANPLLICVDDVIYAQQNFPVVPSNTIFTDDCNFLENSNIITGTVKYDFDNNSCDIDDIGSHNLIIETTDGVETFSTLTNIEGTYSIAVGEGIFSTSVNMTDISELFEVLPEYVETTFVGFENEEQVDFCLTATSLINDLKITLLPLNDARPGFDAEYQLVYQNIGTTILSGDITLEFDIDRQTFLSAFPFEDNIVGNIISWNYTDLYPFETKTINVNFNTLAPPVNESGDILNFTATINPITDDINDLDNVYQLNQVVVNSQDPNDKQVLQGSEIFEEHVGKYLDYIVRFQNVGTASAINVRVDDVLSNQLNWDTFRPISSSHEYRIEILNENFVSFIFEDINLPAEQDDPEGSNGFVSFQVKTNTDIVIGNIIENTASIYFDFNDAIVTNTVVIEVVEPLGINDVNLASSISLIPNPVSEILTISLSENISFKQATVYSILGEKLIETSEEKIDFLNLSKGMYFVEIETEQGTISKKTIRN